MGLHYIMPRSIIKGKSIPSTLIDMPRRLFNVFKGPSNKEPKALTQFLNSRGNQQVVKLWLAKKPVLKPVQKVLNILSFGKYEKTKKDLNYDDVTHNYLIFQLRDGSKWVIERNHAVQFRPAKSNDFKSQIIEIPLSKALTAKEMINTASRNDKDFWKYDPKSKNCQLFTSEVINRNQLMPKDPKVYKEVEPQNAGTLLDSLPPQTKAIPKLVTNIAGSVDRLITGDSVRKCNKKRDTKGRFIK